MITGLKTSARQARGPGGTFVWTRATALWMAIVGTIGCSLTESADDADAGNVDAAGGRMDMSGEGAGECDAGEMRSCGKNVGACRTGTQVCIDGEWGPCDGATGPSDERCNGDDDDCDGEVDEGCQWARRVIGSGAGGDSGQGIAVFGDGNVVVTGYYWENATFGEGEPAEAVFEGDLRSQEGFVARYDGSGELRWARRITGFGSAFGMGVAANADGSSIVVGHFSDTVTFGEGEAEEISLTSASDLYENIFIARFDGSGHLVWAKRAGGSDSSGATAVATASDGTAVVTGGFTGSATFGPGEANETTLIGGVSSAFLAKYAPDGDLMWALSSAERGRARDVALLSDASPIVTGEFWDTSVFGKGEPNETVLTTAGSHDIFIASYDALGTLLWAKRAGGTGTDIASGIAALAGDVAVITGAFPAYCTFAPDEPEETTLSGRGVFLARYGPSGDLLSAKKAVSGITGVTAVSVQDDGLAIVVGSFEKTATFGEGDPREAVMTTPGPGHDVFVARYDGTNALLWARQAGGIGGEFAYDVAAFSDGTPFVVGHYQYPATFFAGEPEEITLMLDGPIDVFVARFRP